MFKFRYQENLMDCGPACIWMICNHYGYDFNINDIRNHTKIGPDGTSLYHLSDALEKLGFKNSPVEITFEELLKHAQKPAILYWKQNHFIILLEQTKSEKFLFGGKKKIKIADPAIGTSYISREEFINCWRINKSPSTEEVGVALLVEPVNNLIKKIDPTNSYKSNFTYKLLIKYCRSQVPLFRKLLFAMLVSALIVMIAPFLTQGIIDYGIKVKSAKFISLILLASLALLAGRVALEYIKRQLLFYISSKVGILIGVSFWRKMLYLPISFFENKKTGDLVQRINDHKRIQSFLTTTTVYTVFSFLSFFIYLGIIIYYNSLIAFIVLLTTSLYALGLFYLFKRRRLLDYQEFDLASQEQNQIIETVEGIIDLKIYQAETYQQKIWERFQVRNYKTGLESLSISQFQTIISYMLIEGRNIFVIALTSFQVLNNQITLGAMFTLVFVVGQMNGIIEHLVTFLQDWQLVKISLNRTNEILTQEDEVFQNDQHKYQSISSFSNLDSHISIKNVSFNYSNDRGKNILENFTLDIPLKKTTAIVGLSGSGKSTLAKLIMKLLSPTDGDIYINNFSVANHATPLSMITHQEWRSYCTAILQDGYIFSESIEKNIALGMESIDKEKMKEVIALANLDDVINGLPFGSSTKIGKEGVGLSAGQLQRVLIARALYKESKILLLDEATSALDAYNESDIYYKIKQKYPEKTIIFITHRLSTIKYADQIVIIQNGRVLEVGNHKDLFSKKGFYYDLVMKQ